MCDPDKCLCPHVQQERARLRVGRAEMVRENARAKRLGLPLPYPGIGDPAPVLPGLESEPQYDPGL